jgi:calcineurin-like phosphoesterase family protein
MPVLGYISDLHLEFRKDMVKDGVSFDDVVIDYFNSFTGKIDFLIIAGDIHSDQKKREKFLSRLTVPVKYVMGNHDFFKLEVYDDFFDEDGITGAGLWTNFNNNPLNEIIAREQIWDYRWIPKWTTEKCKALHFEQMRKIMASPSEIVVTHFPPSFGSITDRFKGDPLSTAYFCNNLDSQILGSNKKLWIHGHVHSDHDYMIGDCRVVCNAMGYPNELHKRQEIKIIDI